MLTMLILIGKEAYILIKTLAFPDKPILLPYTTLKQLLLDRVKYTNFECSKREKFHKTIHQDVRNLTTLILCPSPKRNQCYSYNDSLRSCESGHEDERKFGKCVFCDKFHPCDSCVFCNSKCFKCDEIGHIQSACDNTVHLTATNAKICNCYPINLSVSNDHSSLSILRKAV
ncbi:unnamed protein product [Schistosoma mattheei]|uniref:CCHC-type domain-containing protein n=1 Tax=Schistosoma mattheei TaxID=31246 RepID=A0AA85BE77_9TREM|nr:unnamed protein product [Schistosoma mattheei]